jgi:NADH:ubiquinone oxidoreductase subunit K
MVTIKNKYVLLAAGFWLSGIVLLLVGATYKAQSWAGTVLSIGIVGQAIGFGFLGFAIMQSVFRKKE